VVGSKRIPWYLLSPTIIILLIVGLLPFIYVLIVSFYNWNPLGKSDEMTFIAGDNFRKLVFDEDFLLSVWRSIKYAFTTLFFEFIIGFLLALSLRESFPFRPFFQNRSYSPLSSSSHRCWIDLQALYSFRLRPIPSFLEGMVWIFF